MKKLLFLVAFLALGGCANGTTQYWSALSTVTATYTNPITKDKLALVENGAIVVLTALKAYKADCAKGIVDVNCRSNVAAIQQYTRQLPPLLQDLRAFVKNNDQVSAIRNYNEIVNLINDAKAIATARNVKVS